MRQPPHAARGTALARAPATTTGCGDGLAVPAFDSLLTMLPSMTATVGPPCSGDTADISSVASRKQREDDNYEVMAAQ